VYCGSKKEKLIRKPGKQERKKEKEETGYLMSEV
jgi:hypothetical protein